MSAKNLDKKNRFRSKTVAFRVSPEEWNQFEIAVKLSGLTKQEYLINRISEKDIVVQGNPRVYKALRNQLSDVLVELSRIDGLIDGLDNELLETINLITVTLQGLREEFN
ncbi:MAG: plasmid mobilization protein [Phocaeicola sp.]